MGAGQGPETRRRTSSRYQAVKVSLVAKLWKKGRGRLGAFAPLHGSWVAEATSEMGPVRCHRRLEPILGSTCLRLVVRWEFGSAGSRRLFEELAIIGVATMVESGSGPLRPMASAPRVVWRT